jgi:hypothetical protein
MKILSKSMGMTYKLMYSNAKQIDKDLKKLSADEIKSLFAKLHDLCGA